MLTPSLLRRSVLGSCWCHTLLRAAAAGDHAATLLKGLWQPSCDSSPLAHSWAYHSQHVRVHAHPGCCCCTADSQSPSSASATSEVDEVRRRILAFFNASARDYSVVFTSGATAALKLVLDLNLMDGIAYCDLIIMHHCLPRSESAFRGVQRASFDMP